MKQNMDGIFVLIATELYLVTDYIGLEDIWKRYRYSKH